MGKITFSIIIATYNSETVIKNCLENIINQTYKNYEIIIIDGKSKDDTIREVDKYASSIKHIVSEPDHGVYDAWNKGIALAKGDWVTFIGSDDLLHADALQNYADFILGNAENRFDFISSRLYVINAKGKILRTLGWPWNWKISRKVNNIAHPGSIHSKDLFVKYGMYDTNFKIAGDYEMLLRGRDKLKTGFMDKVTLSMRIGGLSDSYQVYVEHFKAVVKTGDLNLPVAFFSVAKEYSKFFIRRAFRLIGVNIVLKK